MAFQKSSHIITQLYTYIQRHSNYISMYLYLLILQLAKSCPQPDIKLLSQMQLFQIGFVPFTPKVILYSLIFYIIIATSVTSKQLQQFATQLCSYILQLLIHVHIHTQLAIHIILHINGNNIMIISKAIIKQLVTILYIAVQLYMRLKLYSVQNFTATITNLPMYVLLLITMVQFSVQNIMIHNPSSTNIASYIMYLVQVTHVHAHVFNYADI